MFALCIRETARPQAAAHDGSKMTVAEFVAVSASKSHLSQQISTAPGTPARSGIENKGFGLLW